MGRNRRSDAREKQASNALFLYSPGQANGYQANCSTSGYSTWVKREENLTECRFARCEEVVSGTRPSGVLEIAATTHI